MKKWILILPIVLLALVACAPGAEPESEVSVAVASPEVTESPLAEVATDMPPTEVSSPPTGVPTNAPPTQPTAIPTDEPVIEPTAVPTEEPTAETAVIAGRTTEEGAFFLGAVDAPVTMIDYSDFL